MSVFCYSRFRNGDYSNKPEEQSGTNMSETHSNHTLRLVYKNNKTKPQRDAPEVTLRAPRGDGAELGLINQSAALEWPFGSGCGAPSTLSVRTMRETRSGPNRTGRDRTMLATSRCGVMAAVWVFLAVLARLGAADIPGPETGGRLDDFEQLFSDLKIPRGTPENTTYFPVQVWKFLTGKEAAPRGPGRAERGQVWEDVERSCCRFPS